MKAVHRRGPPAIMTTERGVQQPVMTAAAAVTAAAVEIVMITTVTLSNTSAGPATTGPERLYTVKNVTVSYVLEKRFSTIYRETFSRHSYVTFCFRRSPDTYVVISGRPSPSFPREGHTSCTTTAAGQRSHTHARTHPPTHTHRQTRARSPPIPSPLPPPLPPPPPPPTPTPSRW